MKFRLGIVIGFAAGYYLGAKAGRERYEQLRRSLERVAPAAKIRAVVDLGRERLRDRADASTVVPPSAN